MGLASTDRPTSEASSAPDRIRILVVDDEEAARENAQDIFEKEFDVVTAGDADEALAALKANEFDVALLDVRLPGNKLGTDLLREMRKQSDNTRCIMVTGSEESHIVQAALNEGASAYMVKPVNVDVLREKILQVVRQYRESLADQRKLRELEIVRLVDEAALSLDLSKMANALLEQVVEGFQADAGAILLRAPGETDLKGVVQRGLSDAPIEQFTVPVNEGFVGQVAFQKRVLAVEDWAGAPEADSSYLKNSGIASILGAPVETEADTSGVILLAWRKPRAFTGPDRELLRLLADRLGLGVANARLYVQHVQAEERARYLAEVGELFHSTMDLAKVVERVANKALERLGDGCAVFLKRANTDVMECVISRHCVSTTELAVRAGLRDNPVRLNTGTIGVVAVTGAPSVLSRQQILQAYPDRAYLAEMGISSSMAVPLRSRGAVLGVMSFSITESDRVYGPDDLSLAEEFADRAAIAIENANLLAETERRRAQQEELFKLAQIGSATLELPKVYSALLTGAAGLLEASACFFIRQSSDRSEAQSQYEAMGLNLETAEEIANAVLPAWGDSIMSGPGPFEAPAGEGSAADAAWETLRRHGFGSLWAVPLQPARPGGESGAAGIRESLLVFRTDFQRLSAMQVEVLKTIGALAGSAIFNARSYTRERQIASRLQESILPETVRDEDRTNKEAASDFLQRLKERGLDVASVYHPALQEANIGGDFYDVFPLGPDTYGLVIGDVSGKGLRAAVHTAAVKYTLRAYALMDNPTTAQVLTLVNNAVCTLLPVDIFITLFYAVVDAREKVLRFANAGHDNPLLCHANGTVEAFESTGRALGLLAGANYEEQFRMLEPDDVLLLYTDGITEARREGVFLEQEGVANILRAHAGEPSSSLVKHIYQDVYDYTDGQLHDDIALVALRAEG